MMPRLTHLILTMLLIVSVGISTAQDDEESPTIILTQIATSLTVADGEEDGTFNLTFVDNFFRGIQLDPEIDGGSLPVSVWIQLWESAPDSESIETMLVTDEYTALLTLMAAEYDDETDAVMYTATIDSISYQGEQVSIDDVEPDTFEAPALFFQVDDDILDALRLLGSARAAGWFWCAWLRC